MSRYIERETALEFVLNNTPHINGETTMKCVARAIKEVPTADVVEVRHGEWKLNPFFKSIYYCSECGRHIEDGSDNNNPSKHFPYCPHCGAKMDGERNEKWNLNEMIL